MRDQTQKAIEEQQRTKSLSANPSLENTPAAVETTTTNSDENTENFVNNEVDSDAHVNPQ